ncbi:5'-3' exonuclease H3TH domain-containing protein [Acidithiobacillus sp.]|uniref:5'-3' exonuclease family protein n=1 Tax=Acidithiobacillus sp. TaxID=1872118 RepID=UPI00260813D0|nr:5'-3' exonuclease H3TH domain-containing protein [Acidithiobacillus sp.]MDD5278790.1 5'-3' exonuclease H3TH domain-containing protein [Acidithiobacillus sp.]
MTHVLLIDGNNIGYASMYVPALAQLRHNGQQTGGIMGLVQSVIRITAMFPEAIPVVLWDGHAAWRKEICPEYKDNRKSTPEKVAVAESWHQQQPWAATLLVMMGVTQIRSADDEADDLTGQICTRLGDHQNIENITMISGDTDWWQALSERVSWFTPITDKAMTLDALKTEAAKDGPFEDPDEYLLAKCVAGDPSDNIPGVAGVGIKTAVKLLRQHGDLEGIARAVETGIAKDKKSAAIRESMELIERNRKIMDWRRAPAINPYQVGLMRENADPEGCIKLCQHLGLTRLEKRLSSEGEWAGIIAKQSESALANTIELCEIRNY